MKYSVEHIDTGWLAAVLRLLGVSVCDYVHVSDAGDAQIEVNGELRPVGNVGNAHEILKRLDMNVISGGSVVGEVVIK